MTDGRAKLEEMLGWLILAVLAGGCLLVLRPFVSALLWAVVLSFSIWPLHQRFVGFLKGRRTLAAFLMTLAMILVVLLPFLVIGITMADNVEELTVAVRRVLDAGPPAPPAWLAKIPVIGTTLTDEWKELAGDSDLLIEKGRSIVEPASKGLLKIGIILGTGLIELTLSIFITFFLLRDGIAAAERLQTAIGRVSGERGQHLLKVAGNTVRGVVYGILGTALAQAVMAGVGFAVAGVPGASVLALLTFFLSALPFGPPVVWLPAALWLFHQGASGWGIFMLIWGVGVSSVDNVVKPWLISQGSDMPFILIFFGVLGGALTFGFIGVFIGPTLLAVGYRLLGDWIEHRREATTEVGKSERAAT